MNVTAPRRRKSPDGFSLIEVMVAVLILGVALLGLARGVTTALVSSRDGEQYSQAVMLAANRIELLRADGAFSDGETEGSFGAYHWRQTISGADVAGLHEVAVEVTRPPVEAPVYSLRTLLYQPPGETPDKPRGRDERRARRKGGRNG